MSRMTSTGSARAVERGLLLVICTAGMALVSTAYLVASATPALAQLLPMPCRLIPPVPAPPPRPALSTHMPKPGRAARPA